MISGIEVQNFKGFRDLRLSGLGPFHVLVGPNGSGKSSFFEIPEFLKDLTLFEVEEAVSRRRVNSPRDLTFDRRGGRISFDIAFDEGLFQGRPVRYRLEIQESIDAGAAIVSEVLTASSERLLWRVGDGPVFYAHEYGPTGDYFSFPWNKSALSQVPPDEQRYPTANLARRLLASGVQPLGLNSGRMGSPLLPGVPPTNFCRRGIISQEWRDGCSRQAGRNGYIICGSRWRTSKAFRGGSARMTGPSTWSFTTRTVWRSRAGWPASERCELWR